MTRAVLGEALLFFTPFALFAVYLIVRRQNPLAFAAWEKSVPWLALIGVVVVALSLVATGIFAPRSTGSYVPPHVEGGRIVPGHFE